MFAKNKILLLCLLSSGVLHLFIFTPLFFSKSSSEQDSIVINVVYKEATNAHKNKKTISIHTKNLTGTNSDEEIAQTAEPVAGTAVLGTDLGIDVLYPRLSRELGESGQVLVEVRKNTDQKLDEPKLYTSSGFSRLDAAAINAIHQAIASGLLKQAFQSRDNLRITFIFKLTDH